MLSSKNTDKVYSTCMYMLVIYCGNNVSSTVCIPTVRQAVPYGSNTGTRTVTTTTKTKWEYVYIRKYLFYIHSKVLLRTVLRNGNEEPFLVYVDTCVKTHNKQCQTYIT